ncbi:MAG: DUF4174 domain-containing protein [Cyclobacteriaceae bacterium]
MTTTLFLHISLVMLGLSLQQSNPLNEYQWQNRLILVFNDLDSEVQAQMQLDKFTGQTPELQDRDLLIFRIDDSQVSDGLDSKVTDIEAASLRKSFNIDIEEFVVLLIGKDGGVKLRSEEVVSSQELFALIDGMPMRRSEIRRKNGN